MKEIIEKKVADWEQQLQQAQKEVAAWAGRVQQLVGAVAGAKELLASLAAPPETPPDAPAA